MKRLFTATLFSFLTMYSSLAGVVVELHLIDHHDHHHIHNDQIEDHHENHQEESLLEHVVFHADHNKESNHAHERQPEFVLSTQQDGQFLFKGPKLQFIPISFSTSLLNTSPQGFSGETHSKTLAYSPPPNRFRNLPLLN